MKANRESVKQLHKKMRAQWQKENPDKKTVINLHTKIHKLNGQIAKKHIEMRFAIRDLLTAEQRKQAKELMQKQRKNKKMNKKGRHHQGRRGQQF